MGAQRFGLISCFASAFLVAGAVYAQPITVQNLPCNANIPGEYIIKYAARNSTFGAHAMSEARLNVHSLIDVNSTESYDVLVPGLEKIATEQSDTQAQERLNQLVKGGILEYAYPNYVVCTTDLQSPSVIGRVAVSGDERPSVYVGGNEDGLAYFLLGQLGIPLSSLFPEDDNGCRFRSIYGRAGFGDFSGHKDGMTDILAVVRATRSGNC